MSTMTKETVRGKKKETIEIGRYVTLRQIESYLASCTMDDTRVVHTDNTQKLTPCSLSTFFFLSAIKLDGREHLSL